MASAVEWKSPSRGGRSDYDSRLLEHRQAVGTVAPACGRSPKSAQNQLDYVFASRGFHDSVKVRAMNGIEEWGASDHCRLLIEVGGDAAQPLWESERHMQGN